MTAAQIASDAAKYLAIWLALDIPLALFIGRAIALHAHPLDDAEQDGAEGEGVRDHGR